MDVRALLAHGEDSRNQLKHKIDHLGSPAAEVTTFSNNGLRRIFIGLEGDSPVLITEDSKHEKENQSFHTHKLWGLRNCSAISSGRSVWLATTQDFGAISFCHPC